MSVFVMAAAAAAAAAFYEEQRPYNLLRLSDTSRTCSTPSYYKLDTINPGGIAVTDARTFFIVDYCISGMLKTLRDRNKKPSIDV